MSGGVSIHVVDVASGKVAQGLQVSIGRLGEAPLYQGAIDAQGLLPDLQRMSEAFTPGTYEVCLQVALFYRNSGAVLPAIPFLDELVYRFGLDDRNQHYHLPFKLTAWGVSCFRGGA